jgi:hypothetical protein
MICKTNHEQVKITTRSYRCDVFRKQQYLFYILRMRELIWSWITEFNQQE